MIARISRIKSLSIIFLEQKTYARLTCPKEASCCASVGPILMNVILLQLYYKDKTGKNKKKWRFFLVLKKDQFMKVDTFVNDRWKARDIRNKRLDINNKKKIRTKLCKPTARDLYIITRKGMLYMFSQNSYLNRE